MSLCFMRVPFLVSLKMLYGALKRDCRGSNKPPNPNPQILSPKPQTLNP